MARDRLVKAGIGAQDSSTASLPSFGDKTAEDLFKEGRAEAVLAYLARIAEGGYA